MQNYVKNKLDELYVKVISIKINRYVMFFLFIVIFILISSYLNYKNLNILVWLVWSIHLIFISFILCWYINENENTKNFVIFNIYFLYLNVSCLFFLYPYTPIEVLFLLKRIFLIIWVKM